MSASPPLALLLAAIAAFTGSAARAQSATHAPKDRTPRRLPVAGFTLALIWEPEHCYPRRGSGYGRAADPECKTAAGRRGFVLHGLWPDGSDPHRWPQYCHPVAPLTPAQLAAAGDATPSPRLLQHEWAKHGSCLTADPSHYFAEENRLFAGFHTPDMASLARRRDLIASGFAGAFAAANPGLRPDMVRLQTNRRGWLEEVHVCLALDRRPRACPSGTEGAAPGDPVKVQAPS